MKFIFFKGLATEVLHENLIHNNLLLVKEFQLSLSMCQAVLGSASCLIGEYVLRL